MKSEVNGLNEIVVLIAFDVVWRTIAKLLLVQDYLKHHQLQYFVFLFYDLILKYYGIFFFIRASPTSKSEWKRYTLSVLRYLSLIFFCTRFEKIILPPSHKRCHTCGTTHNFRRFCCVLNGERKYNFYIHVRDNFFQKGKYDIFCGTN